MGEVMNAELITICGDPGGAAAIAPVIRRLESRGIKAANYCYNSAANILAQQEIAFSLIPPNAADSWVTECLRGARSLLASTSHNEHNWEKKFISAAKHLGIPSLSVLDFWSNYTERFSRSRDDLEFLPDRIAVMDESAKVEMSKAGVPGSLICVTGQPAFEWTVEKKRRLDPRSSSMARATFDVSQDELFVLFASQPLEEFCGDSYGYTEKTVLKALIPALEQISDFVENGLTLMIRPHPRESADRYAQYTSEKIRVLSSSSGANHEIILASDLVLGLNSALLVESCLLGVPTMSLQPNLSRPDPLPTNRLGASFAVYSENEFMSSLKRFIENKSERQNLRERAEKFQASFAIGATENIVHEVLKQWSTR